MKTRDRVWAFGGAIVAGGLLGLVCAPPQAAVGAPTSYRPAGLTARAAVVLDDVAAFNGSRACAVGIDGVVFNTSNGGTSWAQRRSGTAADLKGVAFPTRSRVWAVGVRNKQTASGVRQIGVIIASTDGGKHWTVQRSGIPGGLYAVDFSDGLHGWAAGIAGVYPEVFVSEASDLPR